MLIYTYYSAPYNLRTGDDVRIHNICKFLSKYTEVKTFNLSHLTNQYIIVHRDKVPYIAIPRKFYLLTSRLLRWKNDADLNSLIKTTHYVDEIIAVMKLIEELRKDETVYAFGSMTLFSLIARILRIKNTIIYDPLANYAQTLYLHSRRSLKEFFKYGLYIALHKLQLRASDCVVYPSRIDLENARHMFNINNAIVIPNPIPICYEDADEYLRLRMKRADFNKPYFILLAGGKSVANEEAVEMTIKIFNEIPFEFKLLITGPWRYMEKYIRNKNIEILGVIPHEKLKKLLAIADYGLAPIFSHASGTFLKTLAYIVAGLDIIGSPQSFIGIDRNLLSRVRIILVKNWSEFRNIIYKIVKHHKPCITRHPILKEDVERYNKIIVESIKELLGKYYDKE